jgi:hypothetical protein
MAYTSAEVEEEEVVLPLYGYRKISSIYTAKNNLYFNVLKSGTQGFYPFYSTLDSMC